MAAAAGLNPALLERCRFESGLGHSCPVGPVGSGRRPVKAEIAGSSPVRDATTELTPRRKTWSQLSEVAESGRKRSTANAVVIVRGPVGSNPTLTAW